MSLGRGHALVIGGTGMLRDVVLHLATRFPAGPVSVLARSHARLSWLVREAKSRGGHVQPFAADWHDDAAVALAIRSAIIAHGPVELAVCWVHLDAPRVLPLVADVIGDARHPPRLFRIVGSAHADPSAADSNPLKGAEGIRPRRVVLGFVPGPMGSGSRWLTDGEIAAGVIGAIERDAINAVVGSTDGWDRRPH